MPIFCFDVNVAFREILVPITCHNSASIVPDNLAIALDLVERGPENGPLREQTKTILFLRLLRHSIGDA